MSLSENETRTLLGLSSVDANQLDELVKAYQKSVECVVHPSALTGRFNAYAEAIYKDCKKHRSAIDILAKPDSMLDEYDDYPVKVHQLPITTPSPFDLHVVMPGTRHHPEFTPMPISALGIHPQMWSAIAELDTLHLCPPPSERGVTITDLDGDVVVLPDLLVYEAQYNSSLTCVNYPSPVSASAHPDERIMNHPLLQRFITDLDGDTAIISNKLEYIPGGPSADYEAGDDLLPRYTRSVEFDANDYVSRQLKRILNRIDRTSVQFAIHQALPVLSVKYPDVVIECQPDVRWVRDMKGNFNNTKALLRKGITIKPNLIGK